MTLLSVPITASTSARNVSRFFSNNQKPWVPAFAGELDPLIAQCTPDYRNPSQLQDGPTLVVGAGNSGADIAIEVVRTHETWMAGKESGHIPFRIETFFARHLLLRLVRFVGHHVLSVRTPIGRKAGRRCCAWHRRWCASSPRT